LPFEKDHNITDLLVRLNQGDIYAYDLIYNHYCHKVYSFVIKIVKDVADAEDVLQEVFIKIWESRGKLDDHKSIDPFVFTLAYHSSIDLIRKKANSSKYCEYLKIAATAFFSENTSDAVEFGELQQLLEKLIARMPEQQRRVFLSHREQGLTYPEIAKKMGISKNTVENHMVKALKYLRQNLKGFFPVTRLFNLFF
jgi:RNA polymerase sigma-70 factor (ECF subfamily)